MSTSAQPNTSPTSPPSGQQTVSEPRLVEAVQHLKSLLVPGETLEAFAAQRRLFALTHRREMIGSVDARLPRRVQWKTKKG